MLVGRLPPESATATALRVARSKLLPEADTEARQPERDPESEQWSRMEHLLAAANDQLQALRWITELGISHQSPKWEITPTLRPGIKPKKKISATQEQFEILWDLIYGGEEN